MNLLTLLYKKFVGFSELKISLLLNEQECKKECKKYYTTLKSIINLYKYRIDDLDYLIEKYSKEEKE